MNSLLPFVSLILRIKPSLQMGWNPTVYFEIRVNFYCNSMISQPLPNLQTQFSQKEEVGCYDHIALNQRYQEHRGHPRFYY